MNIRWVCFLILLAFPHVRPMGCPCGEANEIDLTATHPIVVMLNFHGPDGKEWCFNPYVELLGVVLSFCGLHTTHTEGHRTGPRWVRPNAHSRG